LPGFIRFFNSSRE